MICSVACAASSLGFLQATLEPHLRDFNLKPIIIGSMFVVSGGVYGKRKYSENIFQKKLNTHNLISGFSAPCWGMVCDRKNPKAVTFVGAILISVGFAIMGPLPFFNLKKTIPIVIAGLCLHGLG